MESSVTLPSCLICGMDNCLETECSTEKFTNMMAIHLHVIFLLRNVLEVPRHKLMIYLQSDPNVESWISVCDKCEQMVTTCKTIYQNILTAQSQFRKVKQEIIQTLKESPVIKQEDNYHVITLSTNINEDVREYVSQNKYPEIKTDPFISGDRHCIQKLSLSTSVDKAVVVDDDNLFWNWSDGENGDGNVQELLPFKKVEADISASCEILDNPSPLSIDDNDDDDCVYLDSSEENELEQEEKEDLIKIPEMVLKQEDPLSLPVTIDLSDDDEVNDDKNTQKDDDDDFDPDDESVDMDSDEDDDNDQDDDDASIVTDDDHDVDNVSVVDKDDPDKSEDEDQKPIENEEPPGKKPRPHKKKMGLPKPKLNSDDTFSCPICHKNYATFGECTGHIRCLHFARTKYLCNRCGSTTDGPAKLLKHQKKCTGISYACPLAPLCRRRFYQIHSLRIHLRQTHGKDEANLPPKVQKILKKMRELKTKHCEICNKDFKTSSLCQRHREYVHEKKWKCSKCGVVKWTQGDLARHSPNCSEGKSWTCPVLECSLVYKTVGALNIHIGRLHKGQQEKIKMDDKDRPLIICEGCGATFRKKFKLNNHHKYSINCRRARGLEPLPKKKGDPVICQICGKSYLGNQLLNFHVRTVHEKRFSKTCDICGKGYTGKRGLDIHLWCAHGVGEGDKKWRCGVEGCGTVVVGEKKREEHMRIKHGERERTWGCEVCGKKYMHERSLLQHRKEVHVEGRRFGKKKKKVEVEEEKVVVEEGISDLINIEFL